MKVIDALFKNERFVDALFDIDCLCDENIDVDCEGDCLGCWRKVISQANEEVENLK